MHGDSQGWMGSVSGAPPLGGEGQSVDVGVGACASGDCGSHAHSADTSFAKQLFDTDGFPPRWECGDWTPAHGWLHIGSDLAVFGAYVSIPCILVYFMRKRRDLPFPSTFWLFGAFIFSCGLVHLIEASIFWKPWYRFSGLAKLVTAIVSWATVFALAPTVRKALTLPGLASVNARLEDEIEQRRAAEEALQLHNEELEAFTSSVIDREDRVIELKDEVNELLRELEREPKYRTEAACP